jgi:hypothetical protein
MDAVTLDRELDHTLRVVGRATADVAKYCDRSHHADRSDRAAVSRAANVLIDEACRLADAMEIDIFTAYAARVEAVEGINVLQARGDFDGGEAIRRASTWRELQEAQIQHDRHYHPDVFGLHRRDQVEHCCFHLSKLVGWFIRVLDRDEGALEEVRVRRLPDLLLFGIKLATLMGEPLAEAPLSAAGRSAARGSR